MNKATGIFLSIVSIFFVLSVRAQTGKQFSITISDSAGTGLEGASWTFGKQSGTTGVNGSFILNTEGSGNLEVRMLGYKTSRRFIDLQDQSEIRLFLSPVSYKGSEVIISATRAEANTPTAYSMMTAGEIKGINLGQDLPVLLQQIPGVLYTSDAGAGIGYTGISIRGSDATRINVTLNGIPINDSESHGLFWVNMPDLASSITDLQVQRGVGTSTNGAAAFGGSINIKTHRTSESPFLETNLSGGSFGSIRSNLKFGTGILPGNLSLEGRISKINSQGFVDRSFSDLLSGMGSLRWYSKKTQIHADFISGKETTYQSWNGVPESRLKGNRSEMESYIQRNFLDNTDAQNLLNSDSRGYNSFTYDNQTDNYIQNHYHLHFSHQFSQKLQLNQSFHYTRGKGYYEEFRKGDNYELYGIFPTEQTGDTINSGNLTRRRWLDNHFGGLVYNLIYSDNRTVKWIYGGAVNLYLGKHFGESIWNSYALEGRNPFYSNDARKDEFNQFFRIEKQILKHFTLYADIQYRLIAYKFEGFDQSLRQSNQTVNYGFLNPKAGISYSSEAGIFYYSAATGQREPVRDDFINTSPNSRPLPERLLDHELGWRKNSSIWSAGINIYAMEYQNQLVLTGRINDVGAYTRSNAGKSYRRGIEAEFRYKILRKFLISGNAMLSRNRIMEYEYYLDNYDNGTQQQTTFTQTPIALSPEFIGFAAITWQPLPAADVTLNCKSASRQYLDNTGDKGKSISPWTVFNLRTEYRFGFRKIKELNLFVMVNNLLSTDWESHGYTFGYIAGGRTINENFYFPQAGRNYLAGLTLKI